MLPNPTEDDRHLLGLHTLPTDVLIQIQSFLDPEDILFLRKTSKLLYATSKLRIVWINALKRVCSMHGINLSTFHPVENVSTTELENGALSPFWFITRVEATVDEEMQPFATRVIEPNLPPVVPTEEVDIPFICDSIFLVPGGRFVIAETFAHGLALWDIGIHAGTPIKPSPLAVLPKASGAVVRFSPTPDAHGVYICIEDEMNMKTGHTCLSIYEIYPSSPAAAFRPIRSLEIKGVFDFIYVYQNVLACTHDVDRVTVWNFIQNTGVSWVCTGQPNDVITFPESLILLEFEYLTVWDIPDLSYSPIDALKGAPLIQHLPRLEISYPGATSPRSLLSPPSHWVSPRSRLPFFGLCTPPDVEGDDVTMQCYTFKPIGIPNNPQSQKFGPLRAGVVRSLPFSIVHSEDFLRHLRFCGEHLIITWLKDGDVKISFMATPVDPDREVPSNTKTLKFTMEYADGLKRVDFCPAAGRLVVATDSGDIRIMDYLRPPATDAFGYSHA